MYICTSDTATATFRTGRARFINARWAGIIINYGLDSVRAGHIWGEYGSHTRVEYDRVGLGSLYGQSFTAPECVRGTSRGANYPDRLDPTSASFHYFN